MRGFSRSAMSNLVLCAALAFLFGLGAHDTPMRSTASSPAGAAPAITSDLLLDDYPDALAAFGLVKLRAGYTGPAIRVRRTRDDREEDIGFDESGELDIESLKSFAGTSTVTVTVWYDQSGRDRPLRAERSEEPIIVQEGRIVQNKVGNPSILFEGKQHAMRSYFGIDVHDVTLISLMEWGGTSTRTPYRAGERVHDKGGIGLYNKERVRHASEGGHSTISPNASAIINEEPGVYSLRVDGTHVDTFIRRAGVAGQSIEGLPHDLSRTIADRVRLGEIIEGAYVKFEAFVVYRAMGDQAHADVARHLNNGHWAVKSDGVNQDALLLQFRAYQIALYDWLETLSPSDVRSPRQPIEYAPGQATAKDLYPLWVALQSNYQPRNDFLRYPDSQFVLDDGAGNGFEGNGLDVQITRASDGDHNLGIASATWWAKLDVPGLSNPYRNNDNVERRLLAQAAVDLMMLDQYYTNTRSSHPDYGMSNLLDQAYVFYHFWEVLPPPAREAFLDGFARIFELIKAQPYPRNVNTNMDTKGIAAAAYISEAAEAFGRDALRDETRDLVRTWLLGSPTHTPDQSDAWETADGEGPGRRTIFHSAGYVGERSGPETTYNGIALYYLTKAAGVVKGDPAWEWLWGTDGVVDRMAKFKLYQHLPNPDGYYDGPSGYAKRTDDSYVYDQSQTGGRDAAVATLSDYGKPLLINRRESGRQSLLPVPSRSQMESAILAGLASTDFSLDTSRPMETWSYKQFWETRDSGLFYDLYTPELYDEWTALFANDDRVLEVPWDQSNSFSETFGRSDGPPEFWAYKSSGGTQDFGFFVSSLAHAGAQYQDGYKGGGGLHAFWTDQTGIVVLSRLPNFFNSPESDWSNVDLWPVAHIWGVDDKPAATPFSIAPTRDGQVTANLDKEEPRIQQRIDFSEDEGNEIEGEVSLEVTATGLSDGVRMRHVLVSDQQDRVKELWGTIPIHLRDKEQHALTETSIEYWTGNVWKGLTTSLVDTEELRLGRNFSGGRRYAYIHFEEARKVKLARKVFTNTALASTRTRNIHVDLHGSPGKIKKLPKRAAFTYAVRVENSSSATKKSTTSRDVELLGNFPNPFRRSTTLQFMLPHRMHVRLEVYNAIGQRVARLNDGVEPAGLHEVNVDGEDWASGRYIFYLQAGDNTFSHPITLVR